MHQVRVLVVSQYQEPWVLHDLADRHSIEILPGACDAEEARPAILSFRPELVLADLTMPGIASLEPLKNLLPEMQIILISELERDIYRTFAYFLGADRVLSRDSLAEELPAIVHHIEELVSCT